MLCFIKLLANSNFSFKNVPSLDGDCCIFVFDQAQLVKVFTGTAIFHEGYQV